MQGDQDRPARGAEVKRLRAQEETARRLAAESSGKDRERLLKSADAVSLRIAEAIGSGPKNVNE